MKGVLSCTTRIAHARAPRQRRFVIGLACLRGSLAIRSRWRRIEETPPLRRTERSAASTARGSAALLRTLILNQKRKVVDTRQTSGNSKFALVGASVGIVLPAVSERD
ncbi:hypothetical protein Pla8534_26110 [Lignipirellula cremea]|uniref:Uncharacterized protein n=1 Tax=Lignipirellula cremea TaxID=2528010 RepID=A0A518DSK4_9BACT|nr:hypothetical protein Pla8534_26110 [Lignipirellula cremea]